MKKFLLSLAVLALGMSAATAQTTVDFSTAEGLPTVDNTTDVTTATIEGIDFSFFHCKKGTYNRSRSGCYFCFFQQKIEWIWLYEQHPDLYKKAMEFEKNGYTWNQNESLAELCRPERVRQIKLDAIRRQENQRAKSCSRLVDMFDDNDNDAFCANCFI